MLANFNEETDFHVLAWDTERTLFRVGYENAVGGLRTFPEGRISEAPSGGTGGPEQGGGVRELRRRLLSVGVNPILSDSPGHRAHPCWDVPETK